MNMKTIAVISSVAALSLSAAQADTFQNPSAAPWGLKNDACAPQVNSLASGIRGMWSQSKILEVTLSLVDESREYNVVLDVDGCIDHYKIVLSNDSGSKCLLEKVMLVESGA